MAGGSDTGTPRERYRAQVREEIKKHAWEQIATAGASALSLNAIAKRMGLSGPALYRYFAGRDDLIAELVRDAYRGLAETLRARAEAGAGLRGLAHALRAWALADPQRYFLVYGTPLPGRHAPEDTTRITSEIMAVVLGACTAGPVAAGPPAPPEAHRDGRRAWARAHPAPPRARRRALAFWTRLHGVLSLELAGHYAEMGFDPARLYEAETETVTEH
ncbi:TetR/AcrR family transcriptional regulator [Streptomyces sp. NPDC017095]|uniref:TetR/AcrR family transcriptional regulator n=1 Tax=Streptomyces sp. NPDC017095 TaxID=3364977 RepID=UPI00378FD724